MAGSARIDELKKKFDENPGRYFAPLANEYRKAGEIEQAITICRTYLAEKPGHMSGLIVFGQALYEASQFDEARSTFEQALALDPENLIALRHLGDISRDVGDPVAARGWYQRVLDADPRNEEIAAQLAAVSDAAASAAPAAAAAAESSSSGMSGWGDINPEQPPSDLAATSAASTLILEPVKPPAAPTAPPFADPEAPRHSLQLISLDEPSAGTEFEREEPAFGFESTSFSAPSSGLSGGLGIERTQEFGLPGAAGSGIGDIELDRPFETPAELPSTSPADLGLEQREFVPPPAEEAPPAPDLRISLAFDAVDPAEPYSPPASQDAAPREDAYAPPQPETYPEPASYSEPEPEAASPPEAPAPAAFVTETMAELYLKQGYRSEAIGVYRQLVEQHPGDEALREKLRSIEAGDSRSEPAQEAAASATSPSAPKARPSQGGRTARAFFGSLAARRAPQRVSDPYAGTFDSSAAQMSPAQESGITGPSDWIMEPGTPASSAAVAEPAPSPVTEDAFGGSDDSWPEAEAAVPASATAAPGWGVAPVIEPPTRPPTPASMPGIPIQGAGATVPESPPAGMPSASAPSMPGSLDSLFAGASVATADNSAAAMLAGAFGPPEAGASAPTPARSGGDSQRGQPTRAAANELSLDHVFRDSPRKSGAVRQTGSFSFDQFFSDGAPGAKSGEGAAKGETAPTGTAGKTDDEVGQFTSWLDGLKKK